MLIIHQQLLHLHTPTSCSQMPHDAVDGEHMLTDLCDAQFWFLRIVTLIVKGISKDGGIDHHLNANQKILKE